MRRGRKGKLIGVWRGGFIAFASLGLLLFLFGVFNIFFFTQTNYAKRAQEASLRTEVQSLANVALANPDTILSYLETALVPYADSPDPVEAWRTNAEALVSLDCPSVPPVGKTYATYLLYEGVNYSRGSCANYLSNVAQTAFSQVPAATALVPYPRKRGGSGSNEVYPYSLYTQTLRYAAIASVFTDGNTVPRASGVSLGSVRLYLLRPNENLFPYPFFFYQDAFRSFFANKVGSSANIWNGPLFFGGASSSAKSIDGSEALVGYDISFRRIGMDGKLPAVFSLGLHLGGCFLKDDPQSCVRYLHAGRILSISSSSVKEYVLETVSGFTPELPLSQMGGSAYSPQKRPYVVVPLGIGYRAEPYYPPGASVSSSLSNFIENLTPTRTYPLAQEYVVHLDAPDDQTQRVRVLDASWNVIEEFTLSGGSGQELLSFPNASRVRVATLPGSAYALAPQAADALVIRTPGNIDIESSILARNPYCSRPPQVVYPETGGIAETCDGPVPRLFFGLYSSNGSVRVGFIDRTISLNQVFILAPRGSFSLHSAASLVDSARGLTTGDNVFLHLIGGVVAKEFGPWHTLVYPWLDFDFFMSDLPLASTNSWVFWPRNGLSSTPFTLTLVPNQ